MSNSFFFNSIKNSSRYFRRNDRIVMLLARLIARINRVSNGDLNFRPVKEKINVLIRLVRAYANGQYRLIPWKVIASVLAAFVYFINPFDLIPDFTPVVGLTDDFSVLVWVYHSIQDEIDKFLAWENSPISLS